MRQLSVWALILAAGQGTRLAQAAGGVKKQFLEHQGRPLFWHSALTMARVPALRGLVFVFPPDELLAAQAHVIDLDAADALGLPWLAVAGGERRQDSVWQGLQALPPDCDAVLVHDAARPFASAALIDSLIQALRGGNNAAIPAVPVVDTVKAVQDGVVQATLPRHTLQAVQTPQAFLRHPLEEAHRQAQAQGWDVTDDASMVEQMGQPVAVLPGEPGNVKITTAEDLSRLTREADRAPDQALKLVPRVGWGYDVHRYVSPEEPKARPLKLGGVPIAGGPHVAAHSDGDVLLHALADALLGCLGQGDIGQRYPDTSPEFENIESGVLVSEILVDMEHAGVLMTHVDLTIVAQTPKISPWREQIRRNVAGLLGLDPRLVNVKATTEEGLGFTGKKKGLKAVAVVTALAPRLG